MLLYFTAGLCCSRGYSPTVLVTSVWWVHLHNITLTEWLTMNWFFVSFEIISLIKKRKYGLWSNKSHYVIDKLIVFEVASQPHIPQRNIDDGLFADTAWIDRIKAKVCLYVFYQLWQGKEGFRIAILICSRSFFFLTLMIKKCPN